MISVNPQDKGATASGMILGNSTLEKATFRFTVSRSTFFLGSVARLQLYQRRFLRPISHFSAFSEMHMFSFAPFRISVIFQSLRTQIRKTRRPFYRLQRRVVGLKSSGSRRWEMRRGRVTSALYAARSAAQLKPLRRARSRPLNQRGFGIRIHIFQH